MLGRSEKRCSESEVCCFLLWPWWLGEVVDEVLVDLLHWKAFCWRALRESKRVLLLLLLLLRSRLSRWSRSFQWWLCRRVNFASALGGARQAAHDCAVSARATAVFAHLGT